MTEKGIAKILPNDMVLSPLAGYTDAGFRTLAKDFGCGLTVTEMVSAKGLAMNNHVSRDLLSFSEGSLTRLSRRWKKNASTDLKSST